MHMYKFLIQSDLTYPHTSVVTEFADEVRELDKRGCSIIVLCRLVSAKMMWMVRELNI